MQRDLFPTEAPASTEAPGLFADIVFDRPVDHAFTYAVPDALRGRLSGMHIAVVTGGPRLGDLEAGAVASLTSPQFSVVSGGVAAVAGVALIAWLLPELRDYRSDEAPRDLTTTLPEAGVADREGG